MALASPPVVGGVPRNHSGTGNHPVTRVVIHSAVMPCEPGRARQLAEMNRAGSTGGSWHYATDPELTLQCSWDSYVCWHAPPNAHSIGIEMADYPGPRPKGKTRAQLHNLKKAWRWAGRNHRKMLARTARLTAELLVVNDLPVQYVNARGLRAGKKGWTTHRQVSKAFGQSTHWDPGFWPRLAFTRMVKAEVRNIRQEQSR